MGFIDRFKTYIIGGLGIAALLAVAWGVRVDSLRGEYLDRLETIRGNLSEANVQTPKKNPGSGVLLVIGQRDQYKAERDQARTLVDTQSESITRLELDTLEANRVSEANRKLAAEAIRQRDFWIKQARTASTRTERRSAEEELAECEAVLDSLYSSGF